MVHDPVMAYENGVYYVFSTGMGIQQMHSRDMQEWTVEAHPALRPMAAWTHDSVASFRSHVWAPDVLRYRGRWWMAYSCSTFGRNTSAIGLASTASLATTDSVPPTWQDHGCIVASREGRDNWNAIDPAFIVDDEGTPWLAWGSFWDGIQIARLDTTLHIAQGEQPRTIARRMALRDTTYAAPNPTSQHAGRNAIEAPFIFRHGGYYYLFVSHDYCCRGIRSNYKVVVGRATSVEGPYLDSHGKPMTEGGGKLVVEGDRQTFEAIGHCAVYTMPDPATGQPHDYFVCHAYSIAHDGQAILYLRPMEWTAEGWPVLK